MLKNGFRRRLASEAPLQHSSNSQNHTFSSSPVFLQILLAILPFVPSPRAAFYNGPVGPQGRPLLSLPSLPARRPRGRDIVWLMCVSRNRSTAGVGEQRALGLSSSSNDNKCSPHPIRGCSPPAATSTSEAQPPACLKIILPSSFPLSSEETHPGTNTRTHTHTESDHACTHLLRRAPYSAQQELRHAPQAPTVKMQVFQHRALGDQVCSLLLWHYSVLQLKRFRVKTKEPRSGQAAVNPWQLESEPRSDSHLGVEPLHSSPP